MSTVVVSEKKKEKRKEKKRKEKTKGILLLDGPVGCSDAPH
jgi:hypothetical protein